MNKIFLHIYGGVLQHTEGVCSNDVELYLIDWDNDPEGEPFLYDIIKSNCGSDHHKTDYCDTA